MNLMASAQATRGGLRRSLSLIQLIAVTPATCLGAHLLG
jgi:hypothetical protein